MPLVPDVLNLIVGEEENFQVDFSSKLAGDTINSITTITSACSDLDISSQSFDDTSVYFTLGGGTACERCDIDITILSTSGRTLIGIVQARITEL